MSDTPDDNSVPAGAPADSAAPPTLPVPAYRNQLLSASIPLGRGGAAIVALIEVVLICGIPTQIVVIGALWMVGGPPDFKHPSLQFIAMTSFIDTALVALLIRLFLALSGENSQDVFVGRVRPWGEIARGLALVPVTIVAVQVLAYGIRLALPSLHNVDENPYAAYMQTPIEAAIFMVVVILAGGVREELQRAFIIHRFDQHLGGATVGLVLFTLLFGALHSPEGWDAAIVIGLLGLLFGIIYIRRRSAVLNMTAHAGFDAGMVLLQVFGKALGL